MNILVNRTDAIGDNLLTVPLLNWLNVQGHTLTLLTSPRCAELLKAQDQFSVQSYDTSWSLFRRWFFLLRLLKQKKIEGYFYVGGDWFPSFVAWFLKIKYRGGLVSRWQNFLFLNKGERQVRAKGEEHESVLNFRLATKLVGMSPLDRPAELGPKIYLDDLVLKEAKRTLAELGIKGRYVIIHPGMKGHSLNLSPEQYWKIAEMISQKYPEVDIIVSYTPSDRPYLIPFETRPLPRVQNYNGGEKGLRHFCALLKGCALYIGGSTGTTHLANCFNIKMIAFYGPVPVQSATRWAPYYQNDSTLIVSPDVECPAYKKCLGESCQYFNCMDSIHSENFIAFIQRSLEEPWNPS